MDVFINILMISAVIMLFVASYKAFKHKTIMFLKKDQEIQNLEAACKCFGKLYCFEGIIVLLYLLLLLFLDEEASVRLIMNAILIICMLFNGLFRERYIKKTKSTKID